MRSQFVTYRVVPSRAGRLRTRVTSYRVLRRLLCSREGRRTSSRASPSGQSRLQPIEDEVEAVLEVFDAAGLHHVADDLDHMREVLTRQAA